MARRSFRKSRTARKAFKAGVRRGRKSAMRGLKIGYRM